MSSLNQLLTVQILAVLVALVGEITTSELLVTVAVVAFFATLTVMFAQMTTKLLVGLSQSDGRALAY